MVSLTSEISNCRVLLATKVQFSLMLQQGVAVKDITCTNRTTQFTIRTSNVNNFIQVLPTTKKVFLLQENDKQCSPTKIKTQQNLMIDQHHLFGYH